MYALLDHGNLMLSYRGIPVGKMTEREYGNCDVHWITCIALAKRPGCRLNPLAIPFIESKHISKSDAFRTLVDSYVVSVFKSSKSAKIKRRNHTGMWGRHGVISEEDFKSDMEAMKRYIDDQLSIPPNGGTSFASRLRLWHNRCKSKMPDMECIDRIDFDKLSDLVDTADIADKTTQSPVYVKLYNGHEVLATAFRMPSILYWQKMFAIKLADRIVLVTCTHKYVGNTREKYYAISKVTVLPKEVVNAVTMLNNIKDKENPDVPRA